MTDLPPAQPWQRPPSLTRLCVLSFIDQGLVFPLYLIGLLGTLLMRQVPVEELEERMVQMYHTLGMPLDTAVVHNSVVLMHDHGLMLCVVLLARTVVRFIGTLRMWQGRWDGFHIYTSAQLLGVLAPILVAGPRMFNLPGLVLVLMWCFLYWSQRPVFRGAQREGERG